MSVNKVILVGRLGKDPETRYTGGGQAVCNFSLATDESFKDKSGERQKRTEWHRIVIWGKQAEIAQQYLKKGAQIYLEGRIQSREWTDKENQKRTSYEIVATNFRMLGSKQDSGGSRATAAAPRLPARRILTPDGSAPVGARTVRSRSHRRRYSVLVGQASACRF